MKDKFINTNYGIKRNLEKGDTVKLFEKVLKDFSNTEVKTFTHSEDVVATNGGIRARGLPSKESIKHCSDILSNPDRFPNIEEITTFQEVLSWIAYDLDYNYTLTKTSEGNFVVNKLYIEPEYLTYKTECAKLKEGLFEKVEKLWELLNEEK